MTGKTAPKTVALETLLAPRLGEGTVTIEGVGTLTIRTLTRAQALEVQQRGADGDVSAAENLLMHYGIVQPAMTLAQVAQWAESAPAGELQAVSVAIGRISGMHPDSGKAAYKSAGR